IDEDQSFQIFVWLAVLIPFAALAGQRDHKEGPQGHIEVVPVQPLTIRPTTQPEGTLGPTAIIPLPKPPADQELQECENTPLIACLNVINLNTVSGRLRLPTKDGVAELRIEKGVITGIRNLPPATGPATTRASDKAGDEG